MIAGHSCHDPFQIFASSTSTLSWHMKSTNTKWKGGNDWMPANQRAYLVIYIYIYIYIYIGAYSILHFPTSKQAFDSALQSLPFGCFRFLRRFVAPNG
jgi:hypothetical protein